MAQVCSKTPYSLIEQEGLESQYELACEHQHSCIELPARLADGGTRRMCLGFLLETGSFKVLLANKRYKAVVRLHRKAS